MLYTSKSNIHIKSYLESDNIVMSPARQEKIEVEILGTRLLGNEASVNFAWEILLMTSLPSLTFCSLQYVVCSLLSAVCSLQSANVRHRIATRHLHCEKLKMLETQPNYALSCNRHSRFFLGATKLSERIVFLANKTTDM